MSTLFMIDNNLKKLHVPLKKTCVMTKHTPMNVVIISSLNIMLDAKPIFDKY